MHAATSIMFVSMLSLCPRNAYCRSASVFSRTRSERLEQVGVYQLELDEQ